MTAVLCYKGPWAGTRIDNMSAVPSRRVPVYAAPADDMVCADEQVITLLGYYVRWEDTCDCGACRQERRDGRLIYEYLWTERRDLFEW